MRFCLIPPALCLAVALLCAEPIRAQNFHAGVRAVDVRPAGPRNWRGAPAGVLHCTVWYPVERQVPEAAQEFSPPGLPPMFLAGSAAREAPLARAAGRLPLIVLSHGMGGTADQFGWLAPALARRGYLVLGVNHPGNNSMEAFTAEGALLWGERAQDVSDAIDGLLDDAVFGSHVDRARIGAIGYSLGSETVLELAGAAADQERFFSYCLQHADAPTCGLPSLSTARTPRQMLDEVRRSSGEALRHQGEGRRDARVRAVFAMVPPLGEAFSADSFTDVGVPVTLVAGAADRVAPPAENAERFARWLPGARVAVLQGAGHYSFLDSCTPAGMEAAPQFCRDPDNANREAIHRKTAGMAIEFFDRTLRPDAPSAAPSTAGESNPRPGHPVPRAQRSPGKALQ